MSQQSMIKRQDIAGLDAGLSLVSGSAQERFFQALVDYFIQWSACHAASISAGHIKPDRALLVVYSESPKLEPGIPTSVSVNPIEVFAALLTLDDGVAVAVESLSEVIQHVPQFNNGATEAFQFVREHLKADQTFALLMLGQSRMLVHDKGVPIDEWMHKPRTIKVEQLDEAAITPELIGQQLDEFHNEALASHRGTIARLMWQIEEEPTLSVLRHKPELHVQSGLLTYFRGLYRNKVATVDEEVALTEGRVDVRVVRFDQAKQRFITMIELKVLDPKNTDAKNLEWAHQGIEQAHGYKKTNQAEAAFACIYDARRSKADQMPTLKPDANAKGVLLKVQPMEVPDPRPQKKGKNGAATSAMPPKGSRATPTAKRAGSGSVAKKQSAAKGAPKKL
ncbi:PD-(D/E)XK nuclease domain-containing protein [Ralstonia syzygii]|uniref:PD-(D/E)XK nuclease superfamily protein n=2 Tax=Ralstonia syzygii TaxID=28097 RepID=G3A400_9RALS|nr:PD-(D/E)XK nuclease domain-containing protein [Ralstonia syzygii]CCA88620.1 conserved hypothetical protein [Ralstonia syzygii R24]